MGVYEWEMRQFVAPERKFDVNGNGIEEAYIETQLWIILAEINGPLTLYANTQQ